MNDDTRFICELQDQRDAALKEREQLRAELEKWKTACQERTENYQDACRAADDWRLKFVNASAELEQAKRREAALVEHCKDVFENIASEVYGLSECHCDHTRGVTDCAYCASERFINWWKSMPTDAGRD